MNEFNITSRYATVERTTMLLPDSKTDAQPEGVTVVYLRRRFLPQASRFSTIDTHIVVQGERPDHVAAQHLGDAEQYWRLCDANNVMHPDELTAEIGRRLRITLPEGIPGSPYA